VNRSALGDGGATLVDPRLPADSAVRRTHFHERHVLIRPYIPEGFRAVPGMDPALPFERRTIFVQGRNPKHPRVWGWVLAVREADLDRDPSLVPGAMVVYDRHSDEHLSADRPAVPAFPGQQFDTHLIHIESVAATFNPPLIAAPDWT
jgi:hypothetical protein